MTNTPGDAAAQDEARRLALAELLTYVQPEHVEAALRCYLRAEQAGVDGAHLRLVARQANRRPVLGPASDHRTRDDGFLGLQIAPSTPLTDKHRVTLGA